MSQPYAPTAAGWPPPAPPQAWQYAVPPRPPKPELSLRPAVWWSVAINAIYTVGICLFVAAVFGLILLMLDAASSGEAALELNARETWILVGVFAAGFVASFVLGLVLTIGALLLLRMGSGFRTFPSFVQGLLASLCAFAASSIIGGAVGVVGELASSSSYIFGR